MLPADVHHPLSLGLGSSSASHPQGPDIRAPWPGLLPQPRAPLLVCSVGEASLPAGSGATVSWGIPRTTKLPQNLGHLILLLPLVLLTKI